MKIETKNKPVVDSKEVDKDGEKLDTTEVSDELKAQQEKVKDAMINGNSAEESGEDEDESEDDEDEESEESEEEDESESDDESEDESEEDESEDDSDDEDREESEEDDKSDDDEDDHEEAEEDKETEIESKSDSGKPSAAANYKVMLSFFKKHADVIPQKTIDDYEKYFESGNNSFIYNDDYLYKINKELKNLNPNLPLTEKLEKAFHLAFSDKIVKLEKNKARVIAEHKAQKINKVAAPSGGGASSSKKSKTYTAEQLKVAEKWGVKLK